MASAKSLRKGQFPSSCKLCNTESKLSWRCIDCDILMCNRCKDTIHPNLRNARKHKVIDIKEVGLTTAVDFNNIPCKSHEGQFCVMFCKSCDQLVCLKCITKLHNGHTLIDISEGYQIKIERLKDKTTRMKIKSKIQEIQKSENTKYMEMKKKMEDHNISQKKETDQYTDNLVKELDQTWETLLKSIEKEESKIATLEIDSNIEDIIQSGDVEKIFEMSNQEINFSSIPSFIPGDISPYNVGVLQQSTDIKLQPIKEYTTDISGVFYMAACKDSLYISDRKVVQKVQPNVGTIKVISNFDIEINGMAVTPSGDLLLAPTTGSVLKQISSTTNKLTDTNYSVHPQQFIAVHVTSDGKVVVGTMDSGDPFPVKGRRAVISMDKDGRNKTIYEYDRNNQRIFTYTRKITSTQSGNICVVDCLSSDYRVRVVVLGQDGDIINIYTGHPDVNTTDNPFRPVFIVTTPSDKIIVSDLNTHTLHILNNKGQLVTHINTMDKGIIRPYSITFTTQGKVYIGCSTAKTSTDNGKLYEVKLPE